MAMWLYEGSMIPYMIPASRSRHTSAAATEPSCGDAGIPTSRFPLPASRSPLPAPRFPLPKCSLVRLSKFLLTSSGSVLKW